jgi:hypothetical protein
MKTVLISATAASAASFEETTPLGASLRLLRPLFRDQCQTDIVTDNTEGLGAVYNRALERARAAGAECVVLAHDDVRIDDGLILDKLEQAFRIYDIVGVAGARSLSVNTRIIGWGVCRRAFKAGWITHPVYDRQDQGFYVEYYGPAPMPCVVLDGVFLALRLDRVGANPFDERFTFDFYDLDFTLSQHLAGKTVGVWPLGLTHLSRGQGYKSERFRQLQELFRNKYGGSIRPFNLPKKAWMLRRLLRPHRPAPPNPPGEFTVSQRRPAATPAPTRA